MFCPKFIHRSFRWSLTWQRAAEDASLPGSSTRALQVFLGAAARGKSELSRHEVARLGKMPRSTVRDGVAKLLAAGWLIQSPTMGLRLAFGVAAGADLAESKGGRKSPPSKLLEVKPCPPIPPPAVPAVAMPSPMDPEKQAIQAELEAMGCDTAGARAAAKTTRLGILDVHKLLADIRGLMESGHVKRPQAMAVWAVKQGKQAARGLRRQVRRIRGEAARKGMPSASAPLAPEPCTMSAREWAEAARDYQDLLAEYPPAALLRVKAEASKAGQGDRIFCRIAGEVLRELVTRNTT